MTTTREAVEDYLAGRRSDPEEAAADAVAAAAALRLAEVLDGVDNASGAANASRELRQQMATLRASEPAREGSLVDDLRRRRAGRLAGRVDLDDLPPWPGGDG